MKRPNAAGLHIDMPEQSRSRTQQAARGQAQAQGAAQAQAQARSGGSGGSGGGGPSAPHASSAQLSRAQESGALDSEASEQRAAVVKGKDFAPQPSPAESAPSLWQRMLGRRRGGASSGVSGSSSRASTPSSSSSARRPKKPLASSLLASISSWSDERVYTYANALHAAGEPLHPLLTAQYDEPDIIRAFEEALAGDDAGLTDDETMPPGSAGGPAGGRPGPSGLIEEAAQNGLNHVRKADGAADGAGQDGDGDGAAAERDVEREAKRTWKDKDGVRLGTPSQDGEGAGLRDSSSRRGSSAGALAAGSAAQQHQQARRSGRRSSEMFLSAASDFTPIRERRVPSPAGNTANGGATSGKKRAPPPALRGFDSGSREGLLFTLLRFPLLLLIFLTIAFEFSLYVATRQAVNVVEYAIAWRGRKGELRKELRQAQSWAEWRRWALEMDALLGYQRWKERDASGLYDWILVRKVVHSLRSFREKGEAEKLLGVLDLCVRNNFAGTEGFRLYSETFYGTKNLIERYVDEVEKGLEYIEKTDQISLEAKRAFYRSIKKHLGTSALCLSGGASFGYYHCGVVRALLDANLLPKYVSGTSAGGLIAALTCTRHDWELKELMVPELADRITACEESILTWGPRAVRTGARFNAKSFAQKAQFFTLGSLTFMEAYKRTGKVLNISVIPADRHSPVKLLNYVTSPDCVIWSALLASAAVPGILNPICLMQKNKAGEVTPWNWGHRFKDGSLRMDIPLQELQSLYNVNYPITSQVNPHVHLFFFAPKGMPGRPVAHRKGKGWRGGFLLSAAEHVLKLHLSMHFKVIRDLDLMPRLLGQDWSSTFLQTFSGVVTIWPKTRALDWARILSDPDRKELRRMIQVGQSVTFPKLHMIENRMRIERAVDRGRKACRLALRARDKAERDGNNGNGSAASKGSASEAEERRRGAREGKDRADRTPRAGFADDAPTTGITSDTDGEEPAFFRANGSSEGAGGRRALQRGLPMTEGVSASRGNGSRAKGLDWSQPGTGTSTPALDDGIPGESAPPDLDRLLPASITSRALPLGKAGDRRARRRALSSGLNLEVEIGASTDDGDRDPELARGEAEEEDDDETASDADADAAADRTARPLTAADLASERRGSRASGGGRHAFYSSAHAHGYAGAKGGGRSGARRRTHSAAPAYNGASSEAPSPEVGRGNGLLLHDAGDEQDEVEEDYDDEDDDAEEQQQQDARSPRGIKDGEEFDDEDSESDESSLPPDA